MKKFVFNQLRFFVLLIVFCSNSHTSTVAGAKKGNATWTLLNYIEADNNLGSFADFNIKAMQIVGSTPDVNILVQLDESQHAKTWRYKVTKHGPSNDESLAQEMGVNHELELIDAVQWAATKYPSQYFMLTLWNHGNGILDEPKTPPKNFKNKKNPLRGILYDYSLGTYLNNQQLDRALATIKSQVLGKNIDIIGMDACLMAMVEVAYQVKEYANLLVASENLEKVPGWHYTHLLKQLTECTPTMDPETFASTIVHSFEIFNKNRNQTYTQSAIYLNQIKGVKEGIDKILACLAACKNHDAKSIKTTIKNARQKSLEFDKGKYIDLYSFFTHLQEEASVSKKYSKRDDNYNTLLQELQQALYKGKKQINAAVCANLTGAQFALAGGLSIYFPRQPIHASYQLTKFSQDSAWLQFIQDNHP